MSFSSGSVTFRRYYVVGQSPTLIDQAFLDKLNAADSGLLNEVSAMFSGGRYLDDERITFEHVFGDCLIFALRIHTNRVPAAVKRSMFMSIEKEMSESNPGFISKAQKRSAKDRLKVQIADAIKSGRYRKDRDIPILWDVPRQMIYTPAAGDTAAHLATLLEASFGLELEGLSAGSLALRHLGPIGKRAAYEDAQPSRFVAGCLGERTDYQPVYPWIQSENPHGA